MGYPGADRYGWLRRVLIRMSLRLVLFITTWVVRRWGYRACCKVLNALLWLLTPIRRRKRRATDEQLPQIEKLFRAVLRQRTSSNECLAQSATLWFFLRLYRIEADLRIGARRTQGNLRAHAWVEIDGKPVATQPDIAARYYRFDESLDPLAITRLASGWRKP